MGVIPERDTIVRERRRSHRFNLQGRVLLQLGGQNFEFPAADISVTGIGVLLDVAVLGAKPSGEVGICTIESPDLASKVEAYVSVMRIRRVGHQHLVGLRFESISDEQLQIIHAYETLIKARRAKGAQA
jgi:c-di-GMP-binding flagellar brake protein YcgR